jgi:hypothetical protein
MSNLEDALARLGSADAAIDAVVSERRTLDPTRKRAHTLREVGARLAGDGGAPEVTLAFADALATVARSQLDAFPENIFWDLDYVGAALWRAARLPEGAARVARLAERIAELHRDFGRASTIRFRYAHDFVYGFDWARWVARDEDSRASIGPFDVSFLAHMRERGNELAQAIRRGNPRYPVLPDRAWRNPFEFSREPEHEIALHRDLAARDQIPVAAWRADANPNWRADATRSRVERARALGIPDR